MTPTRSGEYGELRRLPLGDVEDWIRRSYPTGRPIQWWLSIVESVETEIIGRLHRGDVVGDDAFRFAATFLMLGGADSVDKGHVGYWLVRFAALAIRCGPTTGLPENLTPDGSARYVLAAMPLTQEKTLTVSRRRNSELLEGADDLPADAEIRALQDVEMLVHSLDWIRDSVTDPELRAEISEWFSVYKRAAPQANVEN